MSHNFTLAILPGTGPSSDFAQLRLLDADEKYLDSNEIDFGQFSITDRHALYNLRHHVSFYHNDEKEAAVIAATGVLIAEKVLGPAIFKRLYASQTTRTLHIRVPGSKGDAKANVFHAALARIPWEIARPCATEPPLSERAMLVCMTHELTPIPTQSASEALPLPTGEPDDNTLRVLFIFAEAQGSTPLGMRQERRALQDLFQHKIYPNRKIVAHFLAACRT